MCLGIPGQIVEISDSRRRLALAEVSGVRREINVACVCRPGEAVESLLGSWVLIHVGFAMARVSEEEAAASLRLLDELGEAESALRGGA